MLYFMLYIYIKVTYLLPDVSQGRSGADGARGMPGETGSKVRVFISAPAPHHFEPWDDC